MFVHVALSVFDKGQIVEDAGFSFVEETIKTAHILSIDEDSPRSANQSGCPVGNLCCQ